MFGRSFRVATVGGIAIEIHPSWLLILGLVSWSLSDAVFPDLYEHWSTMAYWIVGTASAVLLFVAVLLHELAHAFVAIRRGIPVPKITLFIFGGVSQMARQPRTPGEEFAIAAAGPATSVLIALVTGALAFALQSSQKAEGIFSYLAIVNFLLAVFNILPGFPLDGGRVLRSIAWNRTHSFRQATRIAGGVGEMFGYALMIGGMVLLLAGLALNGLWLMFIGWFLLGAARSESQNLQLDAILGRLKARDVMRETFPTVSPAVPLQEVVDHHMLTEGERAVVVERDGAVLGILSVADIRRVPRDRWPDTPVQGAMTPRERVVSVAADAPAI